MGIFSAAEYDNHTLVEYVRDSASGLKAIVALHRLCPGAGGGIRMKPYADEQDALEDALRLSRAMTYKWVLAGFRIGGGKTVVIGDPRTTKTPQMLRSLGRAIDALGGRYIAGSDVGTSSADMRLIGESTPHVRGADPVHGDSAEATAYGVLQAIRAGVTARLGIDTLRGVRIAVQGLGHVGTELCRLLYEAGAGLTVADVDPTAVRRVAQRLPVETCEDDAILLCEVDVLVPCAVGGVIDREVAERLRARLVCGAANNQLADDAAGEILHDRGIMFIPDYVANAGGIINGVAEGPDYDKAQVWAKLDGIHSRCLKILAIAEQRQVSSNRAAVMLAREMLGEASPPGDAFQGSAPAQTA